MAKNFLTIRLFFIAFIHYLFEILVKKRKSNKNQCQIKLIKERRIKLNKKRNDFLLQFLANIYTLACNKDD